ncbi:MAG: hypothetical protein ACRC2T_19100, partial [Thermoguttaceae bacterium]
MGFLKRFFRTVFRDESVALGYSSFEQIPKEELDNHLAASQYGSFTLTDAIRPSLDLKIVPQQGFRRDHYRDPANQLSVPVLMASVSKENLFETFLELLDPLGNVVDVVLESSHKQRSTRGHSDFYREHIDLPVLKSNLYQYEDLLTNDGCTGIAVLNPSIPAEVQFDEHKLLLVYGEDLRPYEKILKQ